MDLPRLVADQRHHFDSGITRPLGWRLHQLERLRAAITQAESRLLDALHEDMRKPRQEAYASEVGLVLAEIDHARGHLRRWARPRRRRTPWLAWPGRSCVAPEPLGVCCIVGPWNYPVQLVLSPLVGAMAAGNCAVSKASEFAPATAQCIADVIGSTFPP